MNIRLEFLGTGKTRKWRITGMLVLLAALLIWWNLQTLLVWFYMAQPRANPLPAFDASKATSLSATRRADLERELFTEVYMWNTQSRRYQEPNGRVEREQRWLSMANEGYELAHLALQVFEPSTVQVHNPLPVLKRLDALAQHGDAGAMCLYANVVNQLPEHSGLTWAKQDAQGREWMVKGAELNHPQCLALLGGRMAVGSDGFAKDTQRGTQMQFDAIRRGYPYLATGSLRLNSKAMGMSDARNRKLVFCWQYHEAKTDFIDASLSFEVYRDSAPIEQRESLNAELNQLRSWHPSVEECIELTQQATGVQK